MFTNLNQAMKAILLGTPVSSEEALSCGLVCDMFKDGQVLDKTIDAAAQVAARGGVAVQLAKEAICRGLLTSFVSYCGLKLMVCS